MQLFPYRVNRKTGAEVKGIMDINIFSLWTQLEIAEFIELINKVIQFFLGPLLDVPEVKESFLDDLSFVPSCFDKLEIFVVFFISFEIYYA